MSNHKNRLERLEQNHARRSAANEGDFRVAGRGPRWEVLEDVAVAIERQLRDPSLPPERRAELEAKAARARQSAQRHREAAGAARGVAPCQHVEIV